MSERTITARTVRKAVTDAGPNPWFRPGRILKDEFRYFGVLTHKSQGTLNAMLDLHARGFLRNDGSEHFIDLIAEDGHDLHDTLPLSREGMRFLRDNWRLRIDRPPHVRFATPDRRGRA